MALESFQCPGVLLIWIMVGQGPTVLAVGAGSVVWTFVISSFLPLIGRLSDILKGPLNSK